MRTPLPLPQKGGAPHSTPNIGPCIVAKQLHESKCHLTPVGLSPGYIVLHGDPTPHKNGTTPHFSVHVYCGHGRPSQLLVSSCCTAHGKYRRAHWRHLASTTEVVHTGATWRIRLNMCFLGPTQTQTTNRSVQRLLYSSRQKVPIFTMDFPFIQNCPFPWGSGPPSNTWFPVPTRGISLNGISIGAAVFVWFTSVTDRQTDRPRYSVGN